MKKVSILGTGSYIPKRVLTNNDLQNFIETNDEWITTRTGIKERHIVENENTSDLAYHAALRAIEAAKINKDEIDMVIVATFSGDNAFPAVANVLQSRLGLREVMAFDINAACSGFVYALNVAEKALRNSKMNKALVIGAEVISKYVDWEDRNTCVLFGDGAGAVILGEGLGDIIDNNCYSRGDVNRYLHGSGTPLKSPENNVGNTVGNIEMNGREVFKFATRAVPSSVNIILEENNLTVDDISLFVFHQANLRIIEKATKDLNIPMEKLFVNIEKYGNTSAASVAIALDEAVRSGRVKRGDKIISVAFGAGFTWGAILIEY
ncbi:ketoacyl-ACP synthase III [Mycoplasmatota bacterium]|nr:ketoacyl-ACP synthase III [Mycoplasmatota bacterium]